MSNRPVVRVAGVMAGLVAAATAGACTSPDTSVPHSQPAARPALSAAWSEGSAARTGQQVAGSFALASRTDADTPDDERTVTVSLSHASFTGLPERCQESSTRMVRSFVSADGHELTCLVADDARRIRFAATVDAGVRQLAGVVRLDAGAEEPLPERRVTAGGPTARRTLRLLSSPDFLNFDIADLGQGPNHWQPGRTENGINGYYRRAIANVMDDWVEQEPDQVLVAGDLVDGHWGIDPTGSGNFGPVDTRAHRVAALDEAARTYYPQYFARFKQRGLVVRPAIGDHELGDNPWPAAKRGLAYAYRARFADYVTRRADGGFRYPSHPRGLHRFTAYAWRPRPDVQLVSLDVFDITGDRARTRLDRDQLTWLRQVLAQARRDRVRWILVQGHTPILRPVRHVDSSALHYEGGADSALWRLFVEYGVDAYLCGEVHAVTASQDQGVVQIAHGGSFTNALTNYLLLDFYRDRIRLTLRDYLVDVHPIDAPRLWETQGNGMHPFIAVDPTPLTIGTADLTHAGLTDRSGILRPWDGVSD